MISYVTIGTNNYEDALQFYDSFISELGGKRMFEAPNGQFYGFTEGTLLAVLKPADGEPATAGNGTMFAFKVESPARVSNIYAKALGLGASDAGEPGPRGDQGFFAAYFRDLDNNKLCVYHM